MNSLVWYRTANSRSIIHREIAKSGSAPEAQRYLSSKGEGDEDSLIGLGCSSTLSFSLLSIGCAISRSLYGSLAVLGVLRPQT